MSYVYVNLFVRIVQCAIVLNQLSLLIVLATRSWYHLNVLDEHHCRQYYYDMTDVHHCSFVVFRFSISSHRFSFFLFLFLVSGPPFFSCFSFFVSRFCLSFFVTRFSCRRWTLGVELIIYVLWLFEQSVTHPLGVTNSTIKEEIFMVIHRHLASLQFNMYRHYVSSFNPIMAGSVMNVSWWVVKGKFTPIISRNIA